MPLVKSPTELTTAATDLILGIECAVILILLWQTPSPERWRIYLWSGFFGSLTASSLLGAVAHGWEVSPGLRQILFLLIFGGIGLSVGLLSIGAWGEVFGGAWVGKALWFLVALGILLVGMGRFYRWILLVGGTLGVSAFFFSLGVYGFLAWSRSTSAVLLIVAALLLSLAGGAVQTSRWTLHLIFPLDHNGLFHLVEMVALGLLGAGVRIGLKP